MLLLVGRWRSSSTVAGNQVYVLGVLTAQARLRAHSAELTKAENIGVTPSGVKHQAMLVALYVLLARVCDQTYY